MPRSAAVARHLLPHPGCANTIRRGLQQRALSSASNSHQTAASSCSLDSWTLTLERGIGKAYGAEGELQDTRAFRGEVFPDLPIATTWQNLVMALSGGPGGSSSSSAADPAPPFTHYTTRPGALKVVTVASNLRSKHEIEMRVVTAAGDGAEATGGQRANALLCVSGSHPVRTLPLASRFMRSSLDTLRIAQRLRERGYIPPSTQLWVVANPNSELGAALLEAKASLGASAVLTQPPLDWPAYLAWLADAERRGLLRPAPPPPRTPPSSSASPAAPVPELTAQTSLSAAPGRSQSEPHPGPVLPGEAEAGSQSGSGGSGSGGGGASGDAPLRLLVGHPVLSSAANLSFWVSLSGCGGSPAAQRLLAEAARAELEDKEAAARYFAAYNRRLVKQVLDRGGVAGLHVMPITKSSKRMVHGMLADGSLPPSSSSSASTPRSAAS